jgi:DNA-binding response OmpR family regulator
MKSPLHILHLEDDPSDAALVQSALKAEGVACTTIRVQNQVSHRKANSEQYL